MSTNYMKPYDVEIDKYAIILANREYWDDFSFEWSGFHSMDEKLIHLAGFVNLGGDLLWVIKNYAKGRSRDYRFCIHGSIRHYLFRLISEHLPKEERQKDNSWIRIMFLDREELVDLLSEELKRKVKYDLKTVRTDGGIDVIKSWYVEKPVVYDDTVLASIERRHKQSYPDESTEDLKRRYEQWFSDCMF